MASSINMLAPGLAANQQYTCRSGTTYTSNAFGVILSVSGQDINDLEGCGCIPQGASAALPWVSGRSYSIPRGVQPAIFLTVISTLYAYPFHVPNQVTIGNIGLSVITGQSGGAARVGIYADNGSGYPGTLVLDSGALVATATAVVTAGAQATILYPGRYWFASIFTATSTFPSVAGDGTSYSNELGAVIGFDTMASSLATNLTAVSGISVAGSYGALPSTFTSGATITKNTATPLVAITIV